MESGSVCRVIGLGLIVALVGIGEPSVAQTHVLTVRPRQIAGASQNPKVDEYALGSVPNALVSVPPQCVGARRCPLLVQLPGFNMPAKQMMDWLRPAADKYGLMLLTPTEYQPHVLDMALQEVLRRFAVDPEKIAIVGRGVSGQAAMNFGISNVQVFSRVGSISGAGAIPTTGIDPRNKTVEFFIDAGFLESEGKFQAVRALRKQGHPVTHVLALRGHEHQAEDYDILAHWLQESWTKPDPSTRTVPSVIADPLPLLTTEMVAKMTLFWISFSKLPDSIRTAARRTYQREVVVPVGDTRPSVGMTDMAAFAAKDFDVAILLRWAGLTPQQHDAYRVALLSAQVGRSIGSEAGPIEPGSAQAQNIAFIDAHPEQIRLLEAAGVERGDALQAIGTARWHPSWADRLRAVGIWRTP